MTSSITIDGVTSFTLKYAFQSEQELREILTVSVVQDGGIVIDYEGFVHIINLFVG